MLNKNGLAYEMGLVLHDYCAFHELACLITIIQLRSLNKQLSYPPASEALNSPLRSNVPCLTGDR